MSRHSPRPGGRRLRFRRLNNTSPFAGYSLWGFGATFVSGALYAWATDEVGKERLAPLLLGDAVWLYGRAIAHDGHEPELAELPQAVEA